MRLHSESFIWSVDSVLPPQTTILRLNTAPGVVSRQSSVVGREGHNATGPTEAKADETRGRCNIYNKAVWSMSLHFCNPRY